jgi:hypothetical protein
MSDSRISHPVKVLGGTGSAVRIFALVQRDHDHH